MRTCSLLGWVPSLCCSSSGHKRPLHGVTKAAAPCCDSMRQPATTADLLFVSNVTARVAFTQRATSQDITNLKPLKTHLSQIAATLAVTSATTASRTASERPRTSTVKFAEPGMTLEAPGHTASDPTVHTRASSGLTPVKNWINLVSRRLLGQGAGRNGKC
jgi:hypothetical protein